MYTTFLGITAFYFLVTFERTISDLNNKSYNVHYTSKLFKRVHAMVIKEDLPYHIILRLLTLVTVLSDFSNKLSNISKTHCLL